MKGKDPAALFYISDWLVSTNEMDADCRGWYLNLILNHYDKGSLPNDIEKLASLANVKFSEFSRFKQVFEQVLQQKFVQNDEGRLINENANAILKAREEFKDKRSDAGKKSYLMRFFRKEYPKQSADIDIYDFVSENIDLEIDAKNEQMIKQMFEHLFELYINRNRDINKDINKEGGMGETKPTLKEIKAKKEAEFRAKVSEFKQYPADMLKSFCDYWTESGEKDKKLRYEKQDVFDISRRLVTWQKRDEQNRGTKLQPQKKGNLSLSEIQQVYNDLTNGNNGYIGD